MQTDENTKTKSERLSLQIAFHTKTKIKKPNPKRSYWHTTEKLYSLETEGETASSLETAYSG